jgi:hypothetical protein
MGSSIQNTHAIKKAIILVNEVKTVWRLEDTIIKLTVISTKTGEAVPVRSNGDP